MNLGLDNARKYIPSEFNRKMRPITELAYWKAAEFRLFMLYVGFVILKSKKILSKQQYANFIKLASTLRLLISTKTLDVDMLFCSELLKNFRNECLILYDKSFMSYNVHSIIHLVEDFKLFGSLDNVCCFPFESYLGLIKNYVKSGNNPLQQVAFRTYHKNSNIVFMPHMDCFRPNSRFAYEIEGAPEFYKCNNARVTLIFVLFIFILVAKSTLTAMLIVQFLLIIILPKWFVVV